MLTPLFDGILFVFEDDVKKGFFQEETDWGFKIQGNPDNSAKHGRWGKVVAVGPDVKPEDVENGDSIFVEPLMWTKGIKHDGIQVWKTDITKVMAVGKPE